MNFDLFGYANFHKSLRSGLPKAGKVTHPAARKQSKCAAVS
jgi:hypothetical protein